MIGREEEDVRFVEWCCGRSGRDCCPFINIEEMVEVRFFAYCFRRIYFSFEFNALIQYLLQASEPCKKKSNITAQTNSITKEPLLPPSMS